MTTKQRIKPTEMLSFRNYSHFIRLCLYWGDRAKPTDSSAMWPEKLNCISKAALRCRATLFVFVKIPHCYSFPSLSASLLIGPSACPTGNLVYVAKLLAAIWVKYSLSNALDMWGELLLCSSFFRNLTKSSYCVSYFFLLLRTLYFISSYSETVAGGWPTLVLWKRENNAKRGCPWRKMMPCSSCSHMQDRFFFQGQQPVRNMTAVLALGNTPLFLTVFGNLAFTTARVAGDSTGFEHWHFKGIIMSMASGLTFSRVGHMYVPAVGNKVEGKGQFLLPCPVWRWTVSDGWEGTCTDSE